MPRKKTIKPPPFEPYTVFDDEGNEHLIETPIIGARKHHKELKATRAKIAICDDINKHPSKWDLTTPSKFAKCAGKTLFSSEHGDDSALRKGYKRVKSLLALFTIYN
jgi:hypothetical protein